jgi:hypothetical protein
MRFDSRLVRAVAAGLVLSSLGYAAETEKVRNDKVVACEDNLKPGEKISTPRERQQLILYLEDGTLEAIAQGGTRTTLETKAGKVKFEPAGMTAIGNAGSAP